MKSITPAAFLAVAWRELDALLPGECCGLLWGEQSPSFASEINANSRSLADSADAIHQIEPLPNLRSRPDRYEIDPLAAAIAERRGRQAGLRLLGYYHAHPDGDPAPSRHDLSAECWPGVGPRLRLIIAPPRRWALYRVDRNEWTYIAGNAASPPFSAVRGEAC